uniref:Putative enolase-phosphatase E1 n=1 Tax=Davidia involucrata TaxID=16924 RepID=A0A5B6Z4T1_DAVIN
MVGDDDLKTHDEKESDGGEVSSPGSQDHHNHQHPFTEGEEEEVEKKEDTSSARSFVTENKPMGAVTNDGESIQKVAIEEGVVQIDSNLKPEDDSESKNVSIEYVEELHHGGSSREGGSSSSSSSDDESHVFEKNIVVLESKDGDYDSVSESAPFVESVKPVSSLSEVVTQITDCVPVGEAYNLAVETAPVVDSDKVSLSEEVVQVTETESAPIENFMASDVVELGLKKDGERMLTSVEEGTGVSSVVMDLGSQNKEDIVVSTSDQNAAASLDAMGFAAQENEDKLLVSFNASRVDTNNGAEHIKTSGIPESSDSQPLVASAPGARQTTSWKSCCGLFEVLTGSNR